MVNRGPGNVSDGALSSNFLLHPLSKFIVYCLVIVKAWNSKYHGHLHELWLKALESMRSESLRRNLPHKSNQVAVVQSSGYGKSRTIHEMSKLIFTIPINLRPKEDSSENAYPPPDSRLARLLGGPVLWGLGKLASLPKAWDFYYTMLLGFIFSGVGHTIRKAFPGPQRIEPTTTKEDRRRDFAKSWKEYLETGVSNGATETFRDEMYDVIAEKVRLIILLETAPH